MWLVDRLVNLMSGLGTAKDKAVGSSYAFLPLDRVQLEAAYRGDWIARKIVDVPAFDETREWRDWQADKPDIEAIEAEEARLGVQGKVTKARKLARLYGGAALLMGVKGDNAAEPLDVERVAKGGLQYLHALSRDEITAGEIETDPVSPLFGEPKEYTLSSRAGAQVTIHPSRVIRFVGAEIPNALQAAEAWGDSVLQAVNDAVQHAGLAAGGIASLLQEAKVDIIKVPNFMESLGSEGYRDKIIERFSLANMGKSTINAVLLDAEEEWDQKTVSFAQLPEVLNTYLQIASGAADIPATRLLGQTPGGLQSSGQSDIRNFYDRISAGQNLELRPALSRLDEVLIRSALGSRPPDVHYTWAPLWQESGTERADIALKKAQAVKAVADTGLIPDRAFARGVQNMFVEDGTFPGLDAALEEFGDEPEEPEEPDAGGSQSGSGPFEDAFNPNQPRDPDGRWSSAGEARFIQNAHQSDGSKTSFLAVGEVDNPAAINGWLPGDVTGFMRGFDSANVRHALLEHGDPVREAGRSQVAIVPADIQMVPRILKLGTIIEARPRKQKPTVTYKATIGKHVYLYTEEVRRGQRQVAFKSMRKAEK